MLDKLMGIRAQERAINSQGHSTRESSASPSSLQSQIGPVANANESIAHSQAIFATQVPLAEEIRHLNRQNSTSKRPSVIGLEKPTRKINNPLPAVEVVGIPMDDSAKDEIAENAYKAKTNAKSSINLLDLKQALKEKCRAERKFTKTYEKSELIRMGADSDANIVERLHKRPERAATKPIGGPGRPCMDQSFSTLTSARKENPVAIPSTNLHPETDPRDSHVHVADNVSTLSRLQGTSSRKRKLNDRISGRDVRISKDQEALLAHPNSWLPAKPGQPAVRANVPINLLEAFNRNADLNTDNGIGRRQGPMVAPTAGAMDFGEDEAPNTETSASDIGSDIALEQWPPSPEWEQLPLDQTPPSTAHPNRQIKASESCIYLPTKPPLISSQPVVGAQSLIEGLAGDGCSGSIDERVTTEIDHRMSSQSSHIKASPQRLGKKSLKDLTSPLVARADELQSSTEIELKSQDSPKIECQAQGEVPSSGSVQSSASSAESDIEMTIPMPLDNTMLPHTYASPQESFPSTAIEAKQSFTQVKRTLHLSTNNSKSSKRSFTNGSRPSAADEQIVPKGTFETNNMQNTSTASTFVSKSDNFSLSSDPVSDIAFHSCKTPLFRSSTVEGGALERPIVNVPNSMLEGEVSAPKAIDAGSDLQAIRRERSEDPPTPTNHGPGSDSPKLSLQKTLSNKRDMQTDDDSVSDGHKPKRGKTKPNFFYPSRSRRRGEIPVPRALDMSHIPDDLPDPAISARQHREDWFAARRSSESSAAKDSPVLNTKSHPMSTSSLPSRSTDNSSGLATPLHVDGAKMIHEEAFTHNTPPSVVENGTRSNTAHSPEHDTWRFRDNVNKASSPVFKAVPVACATQDPTIPGDIQIPDIPDATGVYKFESHRDRQIIPKVEGNSMASQISSLNVPNPESGLAKIPASNAGGDGNSTVPFSQIDSKGAVPVQQSREPVESIQAEDVSTSRSVFGLFKAAYPIYTGDIRHFLTLCKKIEKLWKRGALHKSMWDDFLIRNKIDYARYVQKCIEDGDDPMPYERFYNEEIDEPAYRSKVITPQNLRSIIYSGNDGGSVLSRDIGTASTPVKSSFSYVASGATSIAQPPSEKTGEAAVMIDLTNDKDGETNTLETGFMPQSNSSINSSVQRQVPGTADSNSRTSPSPRVESHLVTTQRNLATKASQKLPHSATRSQDMGKGGDARHGHALSLNSSTANSTMPPAMRQEHVSAVQQGKDGGPRVHAKSSMPEKVSFKDLSAEIRLERQDQARVPLWWQDENTPFKTFAKSYLAIRPGHGNSFAKPEDAARYERKHKSGARKLRHLDVLGWDLDGKDRAGPL